MKLMAVFFGSKSAHANRITILLICMILDSLLTIKFKSFINQTLYSLSDSSFSDVMRCFSVFYHC